MEIKRLTALYGTVPPPWVPYPEFHPISMFWRMGKGEGYIQVWGAWWTANGWTDTQGLEYFRRFPPPPRWLPWMMDVLWDFPLDEGDHEVDLSPWFARVEALGFGTPGQTQAEYLADWEDERWE